MEIIKTFKSLIGLLSLACILIPAFLVGQISVTTTTGILTNPVDGGNVSGSGTSLLKWGGTAQQFRSGYGYAPQPVIFPVTLGQEFTLGTFTHYNRVIPIGSGITAATFNGSLSLNIDGTQINNLNFSYNFLHNETPNFNGQCTGGSKSVCDDLNTITNNGSNQFSFTVGNINYVLTILGFKQNGVLTTQFSTPENQNSTLVLDAIITDAVISAPEPTLYLLLAATVAIGCFIKKRKAVAVKIKS